MSRRTELTHRLIRRFGRGNVLFTHRSVQSCQRTYAIRRRSDEGRLTTADLEVGTISGPIEYIPRASDIRVFLPLEFADHNGRRWNARMRDVLGLDWLALLLVGTPCATKDRKLSGMPTKYHRNHWIIGALLSLCAESHHWIKLRRGAADVYRLKVLLRAHEGASGQVVRSCNNDWVTGAPSCVAREKKISGRIESV
eukprot:SAG11_NODE_354_length_10336_cov_3.789391_9_plen_197_part_00